MKTSKYRSDPVFLDGVRRLKEGSVTRADLAKEWGVSLSVVSARFKYAGLLDELRGTKKASCTQFKADPDNVKAYDEALAFAKVNPNLSLRKVAERFPGVGYVYLCRLAKKRGVRSTL